MAELFVAGQSVETDVQIVTHRCRERACRNFSVHLVAQVSQKRYALSAHSDLQIHEKVKVFVLLCGVLFHERFERFSLDIFPYERPLSVDHGNAEHFGNVERCFFHARLIERLVENARFGIGLIERLNKFVSVAVELFSDA